MRRSDVNRELQTSLCVPFFFGICFVGGFLVLFGFFSHQIVHAVLKGRSVIKLPTCFNGE